MNSELIFLTLVPIILFVVIELRYGAIAGSVAAVVASIGVGLWWYIRFGSFEETLIVELILMIVLGMITARLNDSRFVKFQPVIVGTIFVGYALVMQLWFEPILVRWMPMMEPMLPALTELRKNPNWDICLGESSWALIFALSGHAALVAYAALYKGSITWLVTRVLIYPVMIIPGMWQRICFN